MTDEMDFDKTSQFLRLASGTLRTWDEEDPLDTPQYFVGSFVMDFTNQILSQIWIYTPAFTSAERAESFRIEVLPSLVNAAKAKFAEITSDVETGEEAIVYFAEQFALKFLDALDEARDMTESVAGAEIAELFPRAVPCPIDPVPTHVPDEGEYPV